MNVNLGSRPRILGLPESASRQSAGAALKRARSVAALLRSPAAVGDERPKSIWAQFRSRRQGGCSFEKMLPMEFAEPWSANAVLGCPWNDRGVRDRQSQGPAKPAGHHGRYQSAKHRCGGPFGRSRRPRPNAGWHASKLLAFTNKARS